MSKILTVSSPHRLMTLFGLLRIVFTDPSRCLHFGSRRLQQRLARRRRSPLLRKDYDFLLEAYPGTSAAVSTGVPKYYAVSGAGVSGGVDPELKIEIAPKPSTADYYYAADYYGKTAAGSLADASVNQTWLSVTFPDILLYGSLAEAYSFMKGEPGLIQYYEQRFAEGLATMGSVVTGEQATVGNAA